MTTNSDNSSAKKPNRKNTGNAKKPAPKKPAPKKEKKAKKEPTPKFQLTAWADKEQQRAKSNDLAKIEASYTAALNAEQNSVLKKMEVGATINEALAHLDAAKRKMTATKARPEGVGLHGKDRGQFYQLLQERGFLDGLFELQGNKQVATGKLRNINHWSLTAAFWLTEENKQHVKAGIAFDAYRLIANAANPKKDESTADAKKRENYVKAAVEAVAAADPDNGLTIEQVKALLGQETPALSANGEARVIVGSPVITRYYDRIMTWSADARAELLQGLLNKVENADVEMLYKDGSEYSAPVQGARFKPDGSLVITIEMDNAVEKKSVA